jgi:hypothetical protein
MTATQKIANVCVWCATAAILILAVATVGTLIWVGVG